MKIYFSCSLAGLALLATDLHAGGGLASLGVPANMDFYAGVGGGRTKHSGACKKVNYDQNCDDNNSGYTAYAGTRLEPAIHRDIRVRGNGLTTLGAEAGYIDFGESKAEGKTDDLRGTTKARSKVSGAYLAAVGYIPVVDNIELTGKVGVGYWEQKGKLEINDNPALTQTTSKQSAGVLIGSGLQYKVNKKLALRSEYQHVFANGHDNGYKSDTGIYSIGAVFNF